MTNKMLLQADFEQSNVRPGVLEMLANNLKDDSDKDVSKSSLKESLAMIQKGNKVPYGPANQLLICILRSLRLVDDLDADETFQDSSQANENRTLGPDESNGESSEIASGSGRQQTRQDKLDEERSEDKMEGVDEKKKTPKYGRKEKSQKEENPKEEICRFYANGKCKYKTDCRFKHPKICPKFRQHGDCEVKGCNGECDFFHPNVCRNSLKDKTCSYAECKFFHLKGTVTVIRNTTARKEEQRGANKNEANKSNKASKNRTTGLSPRTKNKSQKQFQKTNRKSSTSDESVSKEEKTQLGQTLEAILRRLDAMESRTTSYPFQGNQIQPLMSPAVPPPGTQTQYQWGSQVPWTQSQTQNRA